MNEKGDPTFLFVEKEVSMTLMIFHLFGMKI